MEAKIYKSTTHTIKGTLRKVKEDGHVQVFDLDTKVQGISGSIFIDKSYLPLFDKLIMKKASSEV